MHIDNYYAKSNTKRNLNILNLAININKIFIFFYLRKNIYVYF